MSDPVIVAIISLSGSILVALASVVTQLFIAKRNWRVEVEKINLQLRGQETSKQREKRQERLLDAMAELLVATDPQSADGVDYSKAVNLILKIQLLLDLDVASEKRLNGVLNELGLRAEEYYSVRLAPIDEKHAETSALLHSHSNLLDAAKVVLKDNSLSI